MPTATKATHTPAPWTVRENENGTLGIDAKEPDGTYCQPARINGDATDAEYGPTTWANARLIAAAPDLLEVCELMRGQLGIRNDFAPIGTLGFARELLNAIANAKP